MSNLPALSANDLMQKATSLHWVKTVVSAFTPISGKATDYVVRGDNPRAIVSHGETSTVVHLNGECYMAAGDVLVPFERCAFPGVALSLALRVWVCRKPLEALAAITLLLALIALSVGLLCLSAPGSNATEVLLYGAAQFHSIMLIGAGVLAVLTAVAFAVHAFGGGVKFTVAEFGGMAEPMILTPGDIPDVSPDTIIWAEQGESTALFAQRMATAQRELSEGEMAVAIPFRSPFVLFYQKGGSEIPESSVHAMRWNVEHKCPDGQMYQESADVSAESYPDYLAFVNWFAGGFSVWATGVRVNKSGNPFRTFAQASAKMVSASLLLMLAFCAPVPAQKNAEQVLLYLGSDRAALKQTGEVIFVFEQNTYTRKGDGTKGFPALLLSGVGVAKFDNDKAIGRLVSISVNGSRWEPVQKSAPPVVASADLGQGSAVPVAGEMLDSASTQRRADAIAIAAEREGRKFLGVARIYWNMVIRILDIGFFAFIGIAGLLRFITNVMNNESRLSIHGGTLYGGHFARIGAFTRFWLAMFVVAGLVTLAIAIFARLSIGDIAGVLTMFFCWKSLFVGLWLGVLYLLERVADRIISNPITDSRPTDFNQPGVQTRRQIPGQF